MLRRYPDFNPLIWIRQTLQMRSFVRSCLAGRYRVSEQMKADALICYYVTQCCNWISSPLSLKQDGVQITSTALRDDVPASLLIHMARVWNALRAAVEQCGSLTV